MLESAFRRHGNPRISLVDEQERGKPPSRSPDGPQTHIRLEDLFGPDFGSSPVAIHETRFHGWHCRFCPVRCLPRSMRRSGNQEVIARQRQEESWPPALEWSCQTVVPEGAEVPILKSNHVALDGEVVTGVILGLFSEPKRVVEPLLEPLGEPRILLIQRSGMVHTKRRTDEMEIVDGDLTPGTRLSRLPLRFDS